MLNESERQQAVERLLQAEQNRKQATLLSETFPHIQLEDSYAISSAVAQHKIKHGAKLIGHKVGLTSKAMQEMSGATEPDFSAMTDDLFIPEDTPTPISRFFDPMIEIEIAFVMKHGLKGPGILPVDVIRATDFVLPAIEIVDFRVARAPGMNIIDTVADLAACGAVVLGANPRRLDSIDVRRIQGSIIRNGQVEQEGL